MTDQEIALKWLASGTWKQDVETTGVLGIIVSTLRDYGAIKAELDVVKEDYEFTNEAATVLHNANESLHAEVKRLKAERDAATKWADVFSDLLRLRNDADGFEGALIEQYDEWRGVVEE